MSKKTIALMVMIGLVLFSFGSAAHAVIMIIDNNGPAINDADIFGGTGSYASNFAGNLGTSALADPAEWPYRNVASSDPYTDSYAGPGYSDPGVTATFTFTNLAPGDYRVWEFHRVYGAQSSDVPVSVFDGTTAGTLLGVTHVDQTALPADDGFNDLALTGVNHTFTWTRMTAGSTGALNLYTITGSTLTVQLLEGASGVTRADAIRIQAAPEPASLLLLACGAAGLLSRRRQLNG